MKGNDIFMCMRYYIYSGIKGLCGLMRPVVRAKLVTVPMLRFDSWCLQEFASLRR